MLDVLITSKTRIKLLLKFFLNPGTSSYLRGLETEFSESTNAIRQELNRFEKAGMLDTHTEGNKKIFKVNTLHPLFSDVNGIIRKYVGIDTLIENVVKNLGDLEKVYLTGDFAKGKESDIVDLVFVGEVNTSYLVYLIEKAEKLISRKVRYLVLSIEEAKNYPFQKSEHLLIWEG